MITPIISIVIPVYNGEFWLSKLLEAIKRQTIAEKIEIIIIDSGSTDNSINIAIEFGVRLYKIPNNEFNHGLTRNMGVKISSGEFVLMTVQDAIPENEKWLETMLEGFISEDIVAVCGSQIVPHEIDKNPLEWYRPTSKPILRKYKIENNENFYKLTPSEMKEMCGWDNVNAIYRKEILINLPFRKISFAEDAAWAKDALLAGYAIAYHPSARVFHYHHENPQYSYLRTFTTNYIRYKLFGFIPKPMKKLTVFTMFKWIRLIGFKSPGINWRNISFWIKYNRNAYLSTRSANLYFCELLKQGERVLDIEHERLCGKPPISADNFYNSSYKI